MPGEVMIIKGQLRSGFMYPMIKFVAISDTDIFGEKKKRKRFLKNCFFQQKQKRSLMKFLLMEK